MAVILKLFYVWIFYISLFLATSLVAGKFAKLSLKCEIDADCPKTVIMGADIIQAAGSRTSNLKKGRACYFLTCETPNGDEILEHLFVGPTKKIIDVLVRGRLPTW
ncbi:hypothetical protein KIW84_015720 [Lathyrus oleraceus]|uniref:Late nodulin domain-containing protein n=1 Tax=Pisum sativum TaxID=3888 RepID=A0A9D5H136_PEA|nr:hypothetical protein KIW84_015720 [Pisum sativum]